MEMVGMREKITRRRAIAGLGVGATGVVGAVGVSELASSEDTVDYNYNLSSDAFPTEYVRKIDTIGPEEFSSVGLWVFSRYDGSGERWPTQIGVVGPMGRGAIIGEDDYWAAFPPPTGHTTFRIRYDGAEHNVFLRDEQGIMERFKIHIGKSES